MRGANFEFCSGSLRHHGLCLGAVKAGSLIQRGGLSTGPAAASCSLRGFIGAICGSPMTSRAASSWLEWLSAWRGHGSLWDVRASHRPACHGRWKKSACLLPDQAASFVVSRQTTWPPPDMTSTLDRCSWNSRRARSTRVFRCLHRCGNPSLPRRLTHGDGGGVSTLNR